MVDSYPGHSIRDPSRNHSGGGRLLPVLSRRRDLHKLDLMEVLAALLYEAKNIVD